MTAADAARPITVLLVEDDDDDVRMAQEAFKHGKVLNRIDVINNGREVIPHLRGEGEHAGADRPDLILLDLNLPGRDGREILEEIKADPDLRRIPVVVLTASRAEEDVARSYDMHANAYVTKPVDFEGFVHTIRKIDQFFISVVRLPPA
jgi:CheY-like chemotaxis protein